MKTLLLMRHADSIQPNSDVADFQRPLSEFGLKSAPFMGNLIYNNGWQPDLIISSPAKRAKQTAVLIKALAEVEESIIYEEELYGAKPSTFMQIAAALDDKYESVLLVGHNPALENFIDSLTGECYPLSPGSIAFVSLDIDKWTDLSVQSASLQLILRPQDLMERVDISVP